MDVSKLLWKPKNPDQHNMFKFMQSVNIAHGQNFADYDKLYNFSVTRIGDFWASVWKFCGVISSPYQLVVDETLAINSIPKWFVGAKLNYAENMLRRTDNGIAIIELRECGQELRISFADLRRKVGQYASALRIAGVCRGDRVAALMPNCLDAAIFMLATASVGAIWSSASPDFGQIGVLDRFVQIEPKVLISVESVIYNGKTHDNIMKLESLSKKLPSVEKIVLIPYIDTPTDMSAISNCVLLQEFIAGVEVQEPVFEQVPFDHPLIILYSSGTTGTPKCIVHSHGGTMIQHLKEHTIHGGMGPKDIYFYYTTTGWMMWNWLISGLGSGATIVLYDGNPMFPGVDRLWKLVDHLGITIFGTSAKYIQTLEEKGYAPSKYCSLTTLHSLYSTGSALKPSSFEWLYKNVKVDMLVGSITGGTDIVSLFAGHNSSSPVFSGEIQCRCLGMAIEARNDSGEAILDIPGDMPFPVMPVRFWNDPTGEKYQAAYFNQIPGVWYHGDYLSINSKTGGVVMLGRSDGTLNPAGVRFGSAELYNIMGAFPQVQDSLAVGQKIPDGERVILFLKMADGQKFSTELVSSIKLRIRTLLSARHVPAIILPILDIPYTITGKKVEVAVKKIISGESVKPNSSLANPECLELYYAVKSKL